MEKWLRRIIEECESKSQKSLEELKKQRVRMSMNIEAGKESFGFDIDLTDLAEKHLFQLSFFTEVLMESTTL